MFGVRLWASASLALFIAYYLELESPFWAATTAVIVCQPSLGASLQKARFRAVGTLVGAVVMVMLLATFPQDRNTMILCLALWCGLCGFMVTLLRNFAAYAAALAGITAAIIFADSLSDPTTAFHLAILRVSEIGIGIGAAGLVLILTDFGGSGRQLAATFSGLARQTLAGFTELLAHGLETEEMRASRRDVERSLGGLDAAIDAAIGESSHLRSHIGNLRATVAGLIEALVAWRNVSAHLDAKREASAALTHELLRLLGQIDIDAIDRDPQALSLACRNVVAQIQSIRTLDPTSCIVADSARDVAIGIAGIADAVLLLRNYVGKRVAWRAPSLVVADPLPAVLNGVRVFAAVLATAVFWVVTQWPVGDFAVVFAAIGTLIFGARGDQARLLAQDYALGAALMSVLAGIVYFGVLPALTSFPALIALLAVLLVPLGMLQLGSWHGVAFLAMCITCLPLLGVANPIAYDAANYFNLAMAILAGSTVGMVFLAIMPVVGPQMRARRLVGLSVRDLRKLAGGRWTISRKRWTALLSRRIEALPPQASLEQAGGLMALLALGHAIFHLTDSLPDAPARRLLLQALGQFAMGRLDDARGSFEALGRLTDRDAGTGTEAEVHAREQGRDQVHLRAALAVILDAIDSHAALLGAPVDARELLLSSFR
ncbi:FUSC family protein [Ancylobacter pratisalsi]|uniref:FUSC family protein n=1 Tax=Ancylobacter pratisalsi TaxID=1745854 RepID=A0A6P1YX95_9HYPH|nr:FUSC family protein [Ancylobacter pratisalsi]